MDERTRRELRRAVLTTVGSEEPSTFQELCRGLDELSLCPSDRRRWAELFAVLKELEGEELLGVERERGNITGLILTAAGKARAQAIHLARGAKKDQTRGLLSLQED